MDFPTEYLGDGVYASCDGYHIWLDLRGQDNTTRIGLEPTVLGSLDRYRAQIESLIKQRAKQRGPRNDRANEEN